MGLARLEIACEIAVVGLPIGRGHEHTNVLAKHGMGGIAKETLGCRVERLDAAALINGDNPAHGSVQDGALARLTVAQRSFYFAPECRLLLAADADDGRRGLGCPVLFQRWLQLVSVGFDRGLLYAEDLPAHGQAGTPKQPVKEPHPCLSRNAMPRG